jgi:hypothetical protein
MFVLGFDYLFLQTSLAEELVKLRKTSNLTGDRNELIDKEFDAFQKLFASFLASDSQVKLDLIPQYCSLHLCLFGR